MFRKTALALVAVAALGAAALVPTAASAGKFYHHHHGWHGKHWGFGYGYGSGYWGGCYKVKRLVDTPFGLRLRFVTVCG